MAKTIKGIKVGSTTIIASFTDGGVTKTASVHFTVSQATGYLTATTADKTYNGDYQTIATIATNSGDYYFGLGSSTTSGPSSWGSKNTALSVKDAGTYYVWAKCDANTGYYNAVSAKYIGTVTVSQRTVTVTAPTIKTDTIRYTGSGQSLLSANGSCTTGGIMYYYVSTSATAPTSFSTTTWSTAAPSKTDVGTYYIWYYAYVSDTKNNTGTNINTIKSLGSKEIKQRTGAAPTFNADSVTATCIQSGGAVNAGAFDAATAGHSGSITYSLISAKNSSGTSLDGWSMTTTTSRIITVPASTKPGTYTIVIRATEAQTTTDTSSYKDATITVTLSKGSQSLTLTSSPTNASTTYPTGGTITASGHAGTISASSAKTSVATVSTSGSTVTVSAKSYGTSVITVTAAATDYVNAVSKTVTWSVERRTGAAPTFSNDTVTATCSQDQTAKITSAFKAATAGHSGTISYTLISAKSGSTSLDGWSVDSDNRTIGIPKNTITGTYTVVVRATEAQTSTDTSSTKDATITVNLGRGTQSLTLTSSPTTASTTYPTGGTITASGHAGTISASSATTSVATISTSGSKVTVSAVGYGTSVITVTAAQTAYVNAVSKTVTWSVERRTGAAPTFNADSVTATCIQSGGAVNAGAFGVATAGHSGSITYSITGVVKDGTTTQLTGWSMTTTTSRIITVPASTKPGTYKVTVRATEAQTTTDTSSYKDAVITVTLSKGSQTLTLDKTTLSLTVPNTGTITASGYAGTLTVTSGTTSVATATNSTTSTITAKTAGTSTITFTAAATDYVNSVTKTATVTVTRRTGAAPTFSASSVTATCSQDQTAKTTSAFTAGTAKHGGNLSYSLVSAKNSNGDTLTNWGVNSSNRTIGIPANTIAGTYTVVVKCTESQTSSDTSSSTNATITVTLSKGTQTLNLDKTELKLTVPNTGSITASGYAGTLTVTSGTTSVATATNSATSTITAKTAGTSTITFTAAATDYVNSETKTATVTVTRRTGATPTFNTSTVTATCSQDQSAKTTSAFTAATANHGGNLSYSFVSAKNSGGTSLTGWTVNSSNRTIGIPKNTIAGTYTVVVRANEAQTSTDTSSYKDATITVALSKGSQTLTLDKTTLSLTVPNTGTITASGYAGTLSVLSNKTSVATASNTAASTITAVGVGDTTSTSGSATITFTAAATDYVNSETKTATVTVTRRTGAAPTFSASSVTATCSQDQTAKTTSAFTAGTAKHGGNLSYSLVSAKNSNGDTLTNWGVNSSNRTIGIPKNTIAGTYTVVVKCTESQTSSDTSSSTNATITVTLGKGTQSLTLTGNPTNFISTYNSGGTITASNHVGTISASSDTTNVATVSVSGSKVTVTCKNAGTSTITVTAAANDYVNAVSKTQVWTINKANATACTTWEGDSKGYDEAQTTPATLTYEGYSGGTIKFRYDTNGGTSYGDATTTAPTRSIVGTTSVQYMIEGDSNHNSTGWSDTVTLTVNAETDAHMTVTLTARTYSGGAQVIATGGSLHAVASYKIGYIRKDIGTSVPSAPTSDSQLTWGSNNSSLSATAAGDYYVYYTMSPGTGHTNSKTREYVGKVTISKASRYGAVSFKSGSTTVTSTIYPNTVNAVVSGNTENGTITWSVTNGTTGKATVNSSGVVTPTQAGTVTVNATIAETANYKAYTATSAELTIEKATGSITYNTVTSVSKYCTDAASAMSSTDTNKSVVVATSSASSSTNTGVKIGYTINSVTKGGSSFTGWTVSTDGQTVTVPQGTYAGTYSVKITATAPTTTNYKAASVQKTVSVVINAVELVSINLVIPQDTIAFGGTTTAVVYANYNNGSDPKDITSSATYTTNPTGIVTIS